MPTAKLEFDSGGRNFGSQSVRSSDEFVPPIEDGIPLACLLWDHGAGFSGPHMLDSCSRLPAACYRYLVAGGGECSYRDDAMDTSVVIREIAYPQPETGNVGVMTTWHEGESAVDVACFFVNNTNFEDYVFERFLVLSVGWGLPDSLVEALRAQAS